MNAKVQLHDIEDAAAFVAHCIRKSNFELTDDQFTELLSEGLVILCDMAGKFEAHRDGYSQAGTFFGYATTYLPRRLGSAWHKLNEHHVLVSTGGKRRWIYYKEAARLDAPRQGSTHSNLDGISPQTIGESLDDERIRRVGNFIPPPQQLPA